MKKIYKSLNESEKAYMIDKLQTMIAVKHLTNNIDLFNKSEITYRELKKGNDVNLSELENYQEVLESLFIINNNRYQHINVLNQTFDLDKILPFCEDFEKLFKYLSHINYIVNYCLVKKSISPEIKVDINKLKFTTYSISEYADICDDWVDLDELCDFFNYILTLMGYEDIVTLQDAVEGHKDYNVLKIFYWYEESHPLAEFKIHLPLINPSEQNLIKINSLAKEMVNEEKNEGQHHEVFVSDSGCLYFLSSDGYILKSKTIQCLINIIKYCEKVNKSGLRLKIRRKK